MMEPVSSPIRHSAIRDWRRWWETDRPFGRTAMELRTLTVKVWPPVPGLSRSTLVKTGFLSPGFPPALLLSSCCSFPVFVGVAILLIYLKFLNPNFYFILFCDQNGIFILVFVLRVSVRRFYSFALSLHVRRRCFNK